MEETKTTIKIIVMSAQLIDVIHLYLGCKVIGTYGDASGSIGYLTGVTNGGAECEIQFILEDGVNVSEEPEFNEVGEVKPILRPLSSITEDEDMDLQEHAWDGFQDAIGHYSFKEILLSPWSNKYRVGFPVNVKIINWLRKNGFDCDELIESGQAIDATLKTVNQ